MGAKGVRSRLSLTEPNCCEGIKKGTLGGEAWAVWLEALTIQICRLAWLSPGTVEEELISNSGNRWEGIGLVSESQFSSKRNPCLCTFFPSLGMKSYNLLGPSLSHTGRGGDTTFEVKQKGKSPVKCRISETVTFESPKVNPYPSLRLTSDPIQR